MGPIDLSEIKRFEVTEVYSDPDALVDIVLVHGLNGHPRNTWTAPGSKKPPKPDVFWPTDLLPAALKSAKARILVYGYNADVYAFGGNASHDMMHQHAQTLLANLSAERKLEERLDVPIIWVAHSLGGILVKRALNLAKDLNFKGSYDKHSIFVTTYGIIFLGTPHTGADAAKLGHVLQSIGDAIIPKKIMDSEPHLIRTLRANNEILQNINVSFLDICARFEMNMVHEAVKTDLKGTKAFIVDQDSASLLLPNVTYYGIEATHSGMCKFESKNSPGFTNVSGTIKSWVMDSPKLIKERVENEKQAQIRSTEGLIREIMGGLPAGVSSVPKGAQTSQSMTRLGSNEVLSPPNEAPITQSMVQSVASIEPPPDKDISPFIIPPGFRPNSLFVGREAQLNQLHKALFDKKRRSEGTSAVLLYSIPGGGKSQLARQYFYSHVDDFPGGVFWVSARSQEQLELGFWDIYRRAIISHQDSRFSPSTTVDDLSILQNPQEFVEIVTAWFRQNHEWLLVLDGIHFNHAEDIQRFIPDSIQSSLIFTSTERSVSGDHRFMNPQLINIPSLSAVEAQQLFLQELDKKTPGKEDLKHSMELVQMMGFHPLVIHTVAQRLKRTRESLAKFVRSYAQGPILRGLDTYKAVVDELKQCGAVEALNLIQILCFFSQQIPVEMISLGLSSLNVRVKAYEEESGASLNNTFMVLNSFALVDRNADETVSSQSSQVSKTSIDNIDMLRMHSVVQDFFVDSLRASGELPRWLTQAIKLFCGSYERADSHIQARGTKGLVEDYRRFQVHAVRLLEHVNRSEKAFRFDSEIKARLISTLTSIQENIEGRTPASSQQIARGRIEPYQVSIFDRTSSSSDTGPETPGHSDRRSGGITTSVWGFEREQYQSPSSITHETSHVTARSGISFPPLPYEDRGYDSDDDFDMSESHTVRGETVGNSGEQWQTVPRRGRERRKPKPTSLLRHRTIKAMDKSRYRDRDGAWRSVATDPRVRNIAAHGTFRSPSGERSSAEDALSTISAKSPPPLRGGGVFIRDRGPSSTRSGGSEPRKIMFMPTYAAALAGKAARPDSSHSQPARGYGSPQGSATTGISPTTHVFLGDSEQQRRDNNGRPVRPGFSAALDSLQSIPTLKTLKRQNQANSHEHRAKDPPPSFTYQAPYPPSDDSLPEIYPNSEQQLWVNPQPYGVNTNPLPFEKISSPSPVVRKRSLPHDYPTWHAQSYPETTSSSPGPSFSSFASPYLPSWSPGAESSGFDSKRSRESQYLDQYHHHESGYTSQPMSRDPSGQSAATTRPEYSRNRRHSLAETEPTPNLPSFSPPISQQLQKNQSQTSYYEQRADARRSSEKEGPRRKSPRLGFAAATMGGDGAGSSSRPVIYSMPIPGIHKSDTMDRSTMPPSNPSAPAFRPRAGEQDYNNIALSSVGSQFSRSTAQHFYSQPNRGFVMEAPEMGRTSSGGIMIDGKYIQFGEYPGSSALFDTFPTRDRELPWDSRGQESQNRSDWERRAEHMPRVGSGKDLARYIFNAGSMPTGDGRGHDTDMTGLGIDTRVDARERSFSNPERPMSASASGSGASSGNNARKNVQDRREYGIRR